MSRRFLIITSILSFFTLSVQFGLSGFSGLVFWVFEILVCAGIATVLIVLVRKEQHQFSFHFLRSTLIFTSVLWVFSLVLLLFVLYQNVFPAAVWKIILSNDDRNIVVYQMSHIATPEYYESIHADLIELASSWYVIYMEWVGTGTQRNQDRFDRLLGIKMTNSLYDTFAGTIGMVAQWSGLYRDIPTAQLAVVDMNIDEIVSRIGTGTIIPESSPVDLEHELSNIENHRGNFLFEPLIRAFLNFLLRNGGDIDPALNPATKLADVIIHDRNHHIVETLRSSDQKRIVLVYGALHFEGIYSGLQEIDPKWKILSIEPLYPYAY